jgi:hypothetical protein
LAVDSDKKKMTSGDAGPKDDMLCALRTETPAVGSAKAAIPAAAALICGFIGVVAWFTGVDFYHRHFFDTGPIVAADNVARVVFVIIFSWLIYVPGAATATLIMSADERAALTSPERAVLGFGIGVGIWHVVMLTLGLLGLYYWSVMVGLCLVVLVASSRHFANVTILGWRSVALGFAELRQGRLTPERTTEILIGAAAAWLLLLRGLFPGGGGDYYTHYFYYYLEVLNNHGLTPNDVWYHYYYSKGSGLAFLGMLLTDPEAPALTTYPCVVFAAVAIATLAARMAPNSLWPAAGAFVYLFYYLVSFSADGGGQFQKDHEEVTALVVLTTWALCMERYAAPKSFRVMAAATAVAVAIVTSAVASLLGFFVGLLAVWSMVRRRWSDMWGHGVVVGAIAGAVLAVFVVSYLQTGLASDQALDLMLRFADSARLDRWGVIPQIIAVAWIRDNYLQAESPFGWETLQEVVEFVRLRFLWPFLTGPIIAVIVLQMSGAFTGRRLKVPRDAKSAALTRQTALRLAALVALLVAVAVLAGRAQSISFARLSSFFVPLLVLLAIAGSVWVLNWPLARRDDIVLRLILPAALLVGTLISWQANAKWILQFHYASRDSMRFFVGRYSLAEAYTFANSQFPFGAINPGTLAAARQVPYGTPIWSTNVDAYCMVPGCLIESVISFKMSGRLDDILGGDPDLAKRRLQEAGLNYFLFMKDFRMIDLLPFSRLFAPETIDRYLGVKWSDGSTFLLTWIGPDTSPIGPDFLDAYKYRRAEPESTWFEFSQLAPRIAAISPAMRSAGWGAAERFLTWRHPPPGTIDIVDASYGQSCRDFTPKPPLENTYRQGNATGAVNRVCAGKLRCNFVFDSTMSGDPVPGCDKDFSIKYRCEPADSTLKVVRIDAEAEGKAFVLECAGVDGPNANPR